MSLIEFRAYGGTGQLIGRSFLSLMALNAANLATDEHKNDKFVYYQMDYDDAEAVGGQDNDANYVKKAINSYNKLNKRNLGFIAPIAVTLSPVTLKKVRDTAYSDLRPGPNFNYSLDSLYCRSNNSAEIKELLESAFTSDQSDVVEEIQRSNKDGCYGDLAVNSCICERIIVNQAFQRSGAYADLASDINNAKVIYAGSTDGGTANTMIDKDVESLLRFLSSSGIEIGQGRTFNLYALRTTPYSKFKLEGKALDVAITKEILQNKFSMSKGVIEYIKERNVNADATDVRKYAYYKKDSATPYWFDALCLTSSDSLDLTCSEAHAENQFHPSHYVEFTAAKQAIDLIAGREEQTSDERLYTYCDGASPENNERIILEKYLKDNKVVYNAEYVRQDDLGGDSIELFKYIRAILHTVVAIKSRMIKDFKEHNEDYVNAIFKKSGAIDTVAPKVAANLEDFVNETRFLIYNLADLKRVSKMGKNDPVVDLFEDEIKYIFDRDIEGNDTKLLDGQFLSIDESTMRLCVSSNPTFPALNEINKYKLMDKGYLTTALLKKTWTLYSDINTGNDNIDAEKIANIMIKIVFELSLYSLNGK